MMTAAQYHDWLVKRLAVIQFSLQPTPDSRKITNGPNFSTFLAGTVYNQPNYFHYLLLFRHDWPIS